MWFLCSEKEYPDKFLQRCCMDGMRDIPMPYSCYRRTLYITEDWNCVLAFFRCCTQYRGEPHVDITRPPTTTLPPTTTPPTPTVADKLIRLREHLPGWTLCSLYLQSFSRLWIKMKDQPCVFPPRLSFVGNVSTCVYAGRTWPHGDGWDSGTSSRTSSLFRRRWGGCSTCYCTRCTHRRGGRRRWLWWCWHRGHLRPLQVLRILAVDWYQTARRTHSWEN